MRSLRTATIVVLAALTLVSQAAFQYNNETSFNGLYYSAAAYCLYDDIQAWDCGHACEQNGGLTDVWRIKNPDRDTFAYAGYHPEQEQIVIAFRGTNGLDYQNWVSNLQLLTSEYTEGKGYVHSGFLKTYREIAGQITDAVTTLRTKYSDASLLITGHSLGGALATLAALDIKRTHGLEDHQINLYTYGQPRVGNEEFSDYVFSQLSKYFRVTHYDDGVAHSPPSISGFRHAGTEVWFKNDEYDGEYIECPNQPNQSENDLCSNSLWFKTGVFSHLTYMGVDMTEQCSTRQPSNTLAAKLAQPEQFVGPFIKMALESVIQ